MLKVRNRREISLMNPPRLAEPGANVAKPFPLRAIPMSMLVGDGERLGLRRCIA